MWTVPNRDRWRWKSYRRSKTKQTIEILLCMPKLWRKWCVTIQLPAGCQSQLMSGGGQHLRQPEHLLVGVASVTWKFLLLIRPRRSWMDSHFSPLLLFLLEALKWAKKIWGFISSFPPMYILTYLTFLWQSSISLVRVNITFYVIQIHQMCSDNPDSYYCSASVERFTTIRLSPNA